MIRHDYLVRWIRRYLQWIAEIVGLVRREEWEKALARADLALRGLLDLSPDQLLSLQEGEIMARLARGELPDRVREKALLLAGLLEQLARIAEGRHRAEDAFHARHKALQVLLGTRFGPLEFEWPDLVPRIEALEQRLREWELPPRTWASLALHYEQQGAFAKAEDAIHEMLQSSGRQEPWYEVALGFYRRLSGLSDEALAPGGLTRAEVMEALADLENGRGPEATEG